MSSVVQLYSMATPNGQKAVIALEEMQIPYELNLIDIMKGDQFKPEFMRINPNSKIPALVDPGGPDGKPISIMESGAILIYLAQKSGGKFWSADSRLQSEILQWLFFQVGGIGPMFGQFGHFYKYVGDKCDHPYPLERYTKETKRLLGVLDRHLADKKFLVNNEYTIADMASVTWVDGLHVFYKADEKLQLATYKNVQRWLVTILERPLTRKVLRESG